MEKEKFSLTEQNFCQTKYLVFSSVKPCFHEIFAKKVWENFCNFHTNCALSSINLTKFFDLRKNFVNLTKNYDLRKAFHPMGCCKGFLQSLCTHRLGCKTFFPLIFFPATFFHIFSHNTYIKLRLVPRKVIFPHIPIVYLLELRMDEPLRWSLVISGSREWSLWCTSPRSIWWVIPLAFSRKTFSPLDTFSIVLNHCN